MAEAQKGYWDGFFDNLVEKSSDLGKAYLSSEEAQANSKRAANENATASQQARIDEVNRQERDERKEEDRKRMELYAMGGAAVLVTLIILVVLFK
ncbi:hypothetical protein [Vibrio taketomensis]|uniref:hypothetical protein n=1 Tax=Vibrio taketomensis TaxID=2572923 RepID=UPI0013897AB2|nr:hypothetical protein [Vibrio taketomensis]